MSQELQDDLLRRSINADSRGRYYTPVGVCRALIAAIPRTRPKLVVELGAGEGALASAAYQRWCGAEYVTVDSDPDVATSIVNLCRRTSHTHFTHDALDDDLAERIGIRLGSVDVGLCNPPYVRPRWRASFGRILEDAGLSGALKSVHDAGADVLFIAQNLRLLRSSGKLGLILPDGLITGEKFSGVREALLKQHLVEKVIQLPSRVFSGTEAQAYLLIMSKRDGETQSVDLCRMTRDGDVSESISVPADVARKRLDYTFHIAAKIKRQASAGQSGPRIGDMIIGILRGTVNSSQISSIPTPVFHLSNFPPVGGSSPAPEVPRKFLLPTKALDSAGSTCKRATTGDILVGRIGRNLHEKVCIVPKGECVISDCVFALKPVPSMRRQLLEFLLSPSGREALSAVSHGVSAKYLTRQGLLDIAL